MYETHSVKLIEINSAKQVGFCTFFAKSRSAIVAQLAKRKKTVLFIVKLGGPLRVTQTGGLSLVASLYEFVDNHAFREKCIGIQNHIHKRFRIDKAMMRGTVALAQPPAWGLFALFEGPKGGYRAAKPSNFWLKRLAAAFKTKVPPKEWQG